MTPTLPLLPPPPEGELRKAVSTDRWSRVARAIARRHGLEGEFEPYASGSDLVCRVGDAVVKLTTPRWASELGVQRTLQAHLSGRLPFAVPDVLAEGELEGWPYLVMRRLTAPSLALVWPRLATRARLRLAARLGAATAALHAVPPPALPGPSWASFRRGLRADLGGRYRSRGLDPAWVAQLEPFVRAVEPFPACGLVLLHTELLGEHVLLREGARGWDVAGLIDLADGRAGSAEYDFVAPVEFVFRGQPGCLRAFLQGYGYPAEALGLHTQRRLLAWGLLHRYGSVRRMLDAAGEPRPTSLEQLARRVYAL